MVLHPEDLISSSKVKEIQKRNDQHYEEQNVQIDLQNSNQMPNNESQREQIVQSESIQTLKQFEYSMNSSYSLHSHLSTAQKIEEIKREGDETFLSNQQMTFNENIFYLDKKAQPQEVNNASTQEDCENFKKRNFMKLKYNSDLLGPELMKQLLDESQQQKVKEKQNRQSVKSYTSCLRQIVNQNHLQSPQKIEPNHQQIEEANPKSQESLFFNKELTLDNQQKRKQSLQQNDNQIQIKKTLPITQKKSDQKSMSPQSPQSQKKNQTKQRLQIRRIPSNLYESYDQLLLTVNPNSKGKILSKDNIISPIKLKEKNLIKNKSKQNQKSHDSPNASNKTSNQFQTNLSNKNQDQQLLVSLPVIEGYCQLKTDSSQIFETKYLINKNKICFQTFKKIVISAITKVKLIEKDDKQITIKITYQQEPKSKLQNFLITLLSESSQRYFQQSYQFFSHIILRKLLLMKLYINELNQKHGIQSPIKAHQSSTSPLPSLLLRKASQNLQSQNQGQTLVQSNLYKKSTFFNSWEKKFFTLTQKNLLSYANQPVNGEKSKHLTQLAKTSEIWTRFELTYGYLVIKMWQSKIQKFQIGIPLCDFTNCEGKNNWLYGLSKNILWKKHSSKEQKVKTTVVD